jgi:hypothetical protein
MINSNQDHPHGCSADRGLGAPAQQCAGATRLVIGKGGKSAVATLVERTSRFLVLVPLHGCDALTVGRAVIAATAGLTEHVRASLT